MIDKMLLKQKLFEKSVIENKLLRAHKLNNINMIRELLYDLDLVENEIKELNGL